VAGFWATSLEEIIGGVIAIISFRQEDGCSSPPVQNRNGALLVDPDPLFTSRRALSLSPSRSAMEFQRFSHRANSRRPAA
jgi:hypothetical protein